MAQNEDVVDEGMPSSFNSLIAEVVSSPINLGLLALCFFLLYKILFSKKAEDAPASPPLPRLPPMKKHDMTYEELKTYDGTNEEKRVCVAVNGKVFDVTSGTRFYGPGGPYSSFAGRDATRGLATFNVEVAKADYDDISDLNSMQMESVREWEIQFQEKYHYVGRLLKPGEEPTDYSDEEDASQDQSSSDPHANKSTSSKKGD